MVERLELNRAGYWRLVFHLAEPGFETCNIYFILQCLFFGRSTKSHSSFLFGVCVWVSKRPYKMEIENPVVGVITQTNMTLMTVTVNCFTDGR